MRIVSYNRMQELREHPFTPKDFALGQPLFVRCKRTTDRAPVAVNQTCYLIRDVMVVDNNGNQEYSYKIDGYLGGVKSERYLKRENFERWYPKQGDLVFLVGETNPLLISRVEGETTSRKNALYLHKYDNDSHEWRFHGRHQEPDVTPAFGLIIDRDVTTAFSQVLDVTTTVITDLGFTGNKGTQKRRRTVPHPPRLRHRRPIRHASRESRS